MKPKPMLALFAVAMACAVPALVLAAEDDGAEAFVQHEAAKLGQLIGQPASAERDAQIKSTLDAMADYDELSRRTLGQPCPTAEPSCQNHWAALTDTQRTEVTALLKQVVEKSFVKNLGVIRDCEVTTRGARRAGGDVRVRTEVRPRHGHAAAVQIDYVVRASNGGYHVVDVLTEGASLTRNYYDQLHEMLMSPAPGFARVVDKLNEQLAKKD